jgi:hypothetical protein
VNKYSIREGKHLQHVEGRVRETVRTCDLKDDEESKTALQGHREIVYQSDSNDHFSRSIGMEHHQSKGK